MITAIASALGISTKAARIGVVIVGILLIIGAFYLTLDAYGDSRYQAGKDKADQEWQDASNKLVQKSLDAGTAASNAAASRQADYAAKVADEKEKIDAAVADGSSPLDVLFPAE